MNILAIGAHPDDIETMCAGTLAKYAAQGHKVYMATATSGNIGSATHTMEEIAEIRKKEAAASAAIIGAEYICLDYDDEMFYEMALPYLKEALSKPLDLKKIAAMVKTRIEVFPDIKELVDFFEELPEYDTAMYSHKKMKTDEASSLEILEEILPVLKGQEDYSNDALYQMLLSFVEKKGCKNGYVMWPVRTAVSGKQMTPAGATEIMEIIGKEESIKRVEKGIELLKNAVK